MFEDIIKRKQDAIKASDVKPLAVGDVKVGDTVEVYRLDKGFTDSKVTQVSQKRGCVLIEDPDGYWGWQDWFWLPGSHKGLT